MVWIQHHPPGCAIVIRLKNQPDSLLNHDRSKRMDLSVIHTADLTPLQHAGVVNLCSTVFEVNYQDFLDNMGPGTHVLGYEERHLVSHAMWVTRWLQPGDLPPLKTAYIEAVATTFRQQQHGYGTAVMVRLASEILDFELAALSSGKPGFYTRLHWEPWLGPTFVRTSAGLIAHRDDGIMVLRLPRTPPLDTHWCLSCEWRNGEIW
jgi:aminoglycoside 2'-N-acetyltransferase I